MLTFAELMLESADAVDEPPASASARVMADATALPEAPAYTVAATFGVPADGDAALAARVPPRMLEAALRDLRLIAGRESDLNKLQRSGVLARPGAQPISLWRALADGVASERSEDTRTVFVAPGAGSEPAAKKLQLVGMRTAFCAFVESADRQLFQEMLDLLLRGEGFNVSGR